MSERTEVDASALSATFKRFRVGLESVNRAQNVAVSSTQVPRASGNQSNIMFTNFSRPGLGGEGVGMRSRTFSKVRGNHNTSSRSCFRDPGPLSRAYAAPRSIESTTVAVYGSELELLKCVGNCVDAKAPPVLVRILATLLLRTYRPTCSFEH